MMFHHMMKLFNSTFITTMFLCISACSDAGTGSQDIPSDWIQVDAGTEFSLMAPSGTEFHQGQGIDSFVGSIRSQKFELTFDYGLYSNPLNTNDGSHSNREKTQILVDGRTAKLVYNSTADTLNEHPWFIGMHVPEIAQTVIGSTKLTITCFPDHKDDYELIKKIFSSIKFKNSQ